VEGNAVYYSCRAKCGVRATQDCKDKCLSEYKVNRADGKLALLETETSSADSTLALHGYVEGNAVYYSCRAKCGVRATQDCKDKCLSEYKVNRADGKLALLETETSSADSTLALHGYVEGNAVYYSCRAKCGVRATQDCKDKCLADYKTNRADGKLALLETETTSADSTLALHGYLEGNAAYYSCRAKCGVRATQECKDKCLAEYKANRADGKLILSSTVLAAVDVEALPEQGSAIPTFIATLIVLVIALGVVGFVTKKNQKNQVIKGSYISEKSLICETLISQEEFFVLP
jgi:hypothetical protein